MKACDDKEAPPTGKRTNIKYIFFIKVCSEFQKAHAINRQVGYGLRLGPESLPEELQGAPFTRCRFGLRYGPHAHFRHTLGGSTEGAASALAVASARSRTMRTTLVSPA